MRGTEHQQSPGRTPSPAPFLHGDIVDRVPLSRRVSPDLPFGDLAAGDRPDLGEVLALPLLQGIEVDRPAVPAEGGGRREELVRREWEVHDDPVEGGEPEPGEVRGVGEHRDDVFGPIEANVVDEEVGRGGVPVHSEDDTRPAGEGDRKRPDAGEHVEHPLPVLHHPENPLPFGREPGREVGKSEVHVEPEPVLGHLGAGRGDPGEDGEPAGAVLALDRALREEDRVKRWAG